MSKMLSLLLLVCTSSLSAQTFDTAKLDKYLAALDENEKAMFSLAVVENGKPVYQYSIGFSDVETKQKTNKDTQYRIGSITKVFTAVIIFQLIEEGKLTLDTQLSTFYPKVKNADEITISMLLSHRSGIHNFTNKPEYLQYMSSPKTKDDMISIVEALESDFTPNSQAQYSNSGYLLLGFIIEDITKSTYAQQLESRIVTPLKLSHTVYGSKIDIKHNQANSYVHNVAGWSAASQTDMSIPHGAGAIISTPTEVATFLAALFSDKLVSAESLRKMKEINQGLGRGLFQFPFYDKKAYGHNGTIDGFNSVVAYFADDNVAFGLTSNGLNYSLNDINIAVLSIYYGLDYKIPDFSSSPVELTKEDLAKYEGVFASKALPLKITLKVKNGNLTAQATGQSALDLTAYSNLEFRFAPAGIVMIFDGDSDESRDNQKNSGNVDYATFELQQGGGNYKFTRE
ncbi:serine hydrolase domain-containing protein [Alteromonas sp. 1_MG-2023]|uniref:serine hydrolase domain-containing protein n=1 Tax=Alteromonas sp. 1_MG-2023 TaxID=3062669 RepID=UPI0026E3EF22|nr:serine hydrolase domain-containing protein [Alteromonas sp. 1_MG-2023]MDO6566987.1 serine hydrolase domain-containing protein [Alteromonas sp. 1_MG-2023]